MKWSDLKLDELDRAIGFTANERLYFGAALAYVGASQRQAGRDECRDELVSKIASGEVSVEEVSYICT